jgi:flagellar basal body-associated protein FliL
MLLLTLDRERCNEYRAMKYKFVIEEDDSKCLTRLLNKTEIMNSIVLTIILTF